ncbi:VanZ family protein [Lactobacillus sp. ESL0791]|uniref:VanZ family protein n=1 Tax=Lactobacillus sp. ESL0791 TaxID=2983234 RepID=UPI0035ABA6E8
MIKQYRKQQHFSLKRILLLILFLLYLWLLLDITLFPILLFPPNSGPFKLGLGRQFFINLIFYVFPMYRPRQLIGNLILLAPLSFFAAIFKTRYRKFGNNLRLMFLSSLLIESLQLIFNIFYLGNRIFDVNDILLNTLGSILGFLFFKLLNLLSGIKKTSTSSKGKDRP